MVSSRFIIDKPKYINAVESLVGGEVGGYSEGPISKIRLFDEQAPPTEEAIQEKLVELLAEYDALQYQRDRQYPNLGEQLDMLFHDMTAGKGTKDGEWYKAIEQVKSDNPKPE